MDSFCNVFLKKRFIKCISKSNNRCYLFVGRVPLIKKIINKIKKNKQNKVKDYFKDIDEDEIQTLYKYLIQNSTGEEEIEFKKEYLSRVMFLNYNDLVFINESINEDDTNETILNKLIYNCCNEKTYTTIPYLHAWYYDTIKHGNRPISFEYEGDVEYNDFFNESKGLVSLLKLYPG